MVAGVGSYLPLVDLSTYGSSIFGTLMESGVMFGGGKKKSKKRSSKVVKKKSKKRSRRSKKKLRRSEKNKKTKYTNKRNKKRIQKLRGGAQSRRAQSRRVTWAPELDPIREAPEKESESPPSSSSTSAVLENQNVIRALEKKSTGLKSYVPFFREHYPHKLASFEGVKSISKDELEYMAEKEGWLRYSDWPNVLAKIIQALSRIPDPISAEDAEARAAAAEAKAAAEAEEEDREDPLPRENRKNPQTEVAQEMPEQEARAQIKAVSPEHLDEIRKNIQHVLNLARDCEKYEQCPRVERAILSQLSDLGIDPDDLPQLEREAVVRKLVEIYMEVKENM